MNEALDSQTSQQRYRTVNELGVIYSVYLSLLFLMFGRPHCCQRYSLLSVHEPGLLSEEKTRRDLNVKCNTFKRPVGTRLHEVDYLCVTNDLPALDSSHSLFGESKKNSDLIEANSTQNEDFAAVNFHNLKQLKLHKFHSGTS